MKTYDLTQEEIELRKTPRNKNVKFLSEFSELEDDEIPKEILDNISNYPSYKAENLKLIDEIINSDGSSIRKCILINGKEKDPKERSIMTEIRISNKELVELEKKQFEKGVLKEINPETIKYHQTQPYWVNMKKLLQS